MTATTLVLFALLAQATLPAENPEAKAKAVALLNEGAELYEKGDLADALVKFNEAYAQYASPKLLFNIGQTSRGLGQLAEAMKAFEGFLTQAADAPEEMRAEARNSVAELQAKLGRLHIKCTASGAEVSLDGRAVGVAPIAGQIWVTPGRHQVTAKHIGFTSAVESVTITPKGTQVVELVLQPTSEPATVADIPAPSFAPMPTAPSAVEPTPAATLTQTAPAGAKDDGWILGRKWTWVAAGSTVVFLGAATAAGLAMQSKYDDLKKTCGKAAGANWTGCSSDQKSSLDTRKNLANAFWGLSAAAAVTTGLLFYFEGRSVAVAPMAGTSNGLMASMSY
jgi:hypothetical protein